LKRNRNGWSEKLEIKERLKKAYFAIENIHYDTKRADDFKSFVPDNICFASLIKFVYWRNARIINEKTKGFFLITSNGTVCIHYMILIMQISEIFTSQQFY